MRIRPITEDDRAAVAALADRLTESAATWRDPAASMRSVRHRVDGSVASALGPSDEVDVLVAEAAGVVAGFVVVTVTRRTDGTVEGHLGELVVGPEHEGHGVGRALVEAAVAWGRGRGVERLALAGGGSERRSRTAAVAEPAG